MTNFLCIEIINAITVITELYMKVFSGSFWNLRNGSFNLGFNQKNANCLKKGSCQLLAKVCARSTG